MIRAGPGAVGDRGELVGGEVGGHGRPGRRRRRQPAELDRSRRATTAAPTRGSDGRAGPPSIHARRAVRQRRRRPRPASAPASSAAPSRPPCVAHHQTGVPVAGVVGVGPDEEVEPVEPDLEAGAELPRLVGDRLAARGTAPASTPSSTTTGRRRDPRVVQTRDHRLRVASVARPRSPRRRLPTTVGVRPHARPGSARPAITTHPPPTPAVVRPGPRRESVRREGGHQGDSTGRRRDV